MIPKEIVQIRKEVENLKFRLSPNEIYSYTALHKGFIKKYAYSIDPFGKIYYEDKCIANGCVGLVIGAHGPYVEFTEEQFSRELVIPSDQQWRTQPKYCNNVKYLHKTMNGIPDLKIYHQLRTVNYADYKPGMYYIDYYLLSS